MNNKCYDKPIDYCPTPYVTDIVRAAIGNTDFRTTCWTGKHLQVTLMCIPAGGEIGLECHKHSDQFLFIVSGKGLVQMGKCKDKLDFCRHVCPGDAVCVPEDTWHNIKNCGNCPLKLFSVYAPPEHPHGTVHKTKAVADAEEN